MEQRTPSADLAQRLQIGKSLGAGAFAAVHRAVFDGQSVALKVLLPQHSPSAKEDCPVKMFIREGELLRRLDHENVVKCLAVLELPPTFPGLLRGYLRPTWALVLELLPGGSLSGLMHKQLQAPWKFLYDNEAALEWSIQVASGLSYLHGCSPPVIHRDIKLENIMFAPGPGGGSAGRTGGSVKGAHGVIKLVDLGLHTRPLTLERCTLQTLLRAPLSRANSARSLAGGYQGPDSFAGAIEEDIAPSCAPAAPEAAPSPVPALASSLAVRSGTPPDAGPVVVQDVLSGRSKTMADLSTLFFAVQASPQSLSGGNARLRQRALMHLQPQPLPQRPPRPLTPQQQALALLARQHVQQQQQRQVGTMPARGRSFTSGWRTSARSCTEFNCSSSSAAVAAAVTAALAPGGGSVAAAGTPAGMEAVAAAMNRTNGVAVSVSSAATAGAVASGGAAFPASWQPGRGPTLLQLLEAEENEHATEAAGAGTAASGPAGGTGAAVTSVGLAAPGGSGGGGGFGRRPSTADVGTTGFTRTGFLQGAAASASVPGLTRVLCQEPAGAAGRGAIEQVMHADTAAMGSLSADGDAAGRQCGTEAWKAGHVEGGCGVNGLPGLDVEGDVGGRTLPPEPPVGTTIAAMMVRAPAAGPLLCPNALSSGAVAWAMDTRLEATGPPAECQTSDISRDAIPVSPRAGTFQQELQLQIQPPAGGDGCRSNCDQGSGALLRDLLSDKPQGPDPGHFLGTSARAGVRSGPGLNPGSLGGGGGSPQEDNGITRACSGTACLPVTPRDVVACSGTASRPLTPRDILPAVGPVDEDYALEVVYCLTGETGSCMTMAPEIRLQQPYNEKVDVYAFGVVLYEIWSRSMLAVSHVGTRRPDLPHIVHKCEEWPDLIVSGYRPSRPEVIPAPVWQLITECWDADPLLRPTMQDVEARLRQMAEEEAEEVIGLASGKGGKKLAAARGKAGAKAGAREPGSAGGQLDEAVAAGVSRTCGCIIS